MYPIVEAGGGIIACHMDRNSDGEPFDRLFRRACRLPLIECARDVGLDVEMSERTRAEPLIGENRARVFPRPEGSRDLGWSLGLSPVRPPVTEMRRLMIGAKPQRPDDRPRS